MAACAHANVLHMCTLAAMFNDRTYTENPKEQVEHYLISARKIV